jgi:hypothetical protein
MISNSDFLMCPLYTTDIALQQHALQNEKGIAKSAMPFALLLRRECYFPNAVLKSW